MSHLSSSLQSDNSAGEQLFCREGERMVGVGGCEVEAGETERVGAEEDEVEQAVRGNEKWLNSGSPSV